MIATNNILNLLCSAILSTSLPKLLCYVSLLFAELAARRANVPNKYVTAVQYANFFLGLRNLGVPV